MKLVFWITLSFSDWLAHLKWCANPVFAAMIIRTMIIRFFVTQTAISEKISMTFVFCFLFLLPLKIPLSVTLVNIFFLSQDMMNLRTYFTLCTFWEVSSWIWIGKDLLSVLPKSPMLLPKPPMLRPIPLWQFQGFGPMQTPLQGWQNVPSQLETKV